jgi:glyoxylase-like metal-dependent hydrolase (beta-lactamase superfamily II)
MNSKISRIGLAALTVLLGVACGGSQPAASEPQPMPPPAQSAPPPAPLAPAPTTDPAAAPVPEPVSPVAAIYVEPSSTVPLEPGKKIGQLFKRNVEQPYVLQRLTERTYFFQRQFYGTIFYVGDKGVLLFDPLDGRIDQILQAVLEVTKLPVTAVVYSHDHADHIGGAKALVDYASAAGIKNFRVIASKATAEKMKFLGSLLPKPTEVIPFPRGSFRFERLNVELHGFERSAHTDDHGIWYLPSEKIAHLPDHINPDQPPFWGFAVAESFAYYQSNLDALDKLDWTFLSGGHGNVGSKADVAAYRTYIVDLKQAVGQAMQEVQWGHGVDAARTNAHTVFLTTWVAGVSARATELMRPKYGQQYGFDAGTPRNAEMVTLQMFLYR